MVKSALKVFAVMFVLALFSASPARAKDIRLSSLNPSAEAAGVVRLSMYGSIDCNRRVRIRAFNLEPGATYSVWLVDKDTGKRVPAGPEGNTFVTDQGGSGGYSYIAHLGDLNWKTMEVTLHSGGGPGETVLKARIIP